MSTAEQNAVRLAATLLIFVGVFPPWVAVLRNPESGAAIRKIWIGYSFIVTPPDLANTGLPHKDMPIVIQRLFGMAYGEANRSQPTTSTRALTEGDNAQQGTTLTPMQRAWEKAHKEGSLRAEDEELRNRGLLSSSWRGYSASRLSVELDTERLFLQFFVVITGFAAFLWQRRRSSTNVDVAPVLHALSETQTYLGDLEVDPRDRSREHDLVRSWTDAALSIHTYDPQLAQELRAMAQYWASPQASRNTSEAKATVDYFAGRAHALLGRPGTRQQPPK